MAGFKYTNGDSFVAPSLEFKRNEGHFQILINWISLSLKNIILFTNLDTNQFSWYRWFQQYELIKDTIHGKRVLYICKHLMKTELLKVH